jgi:hypothetical protein
LEQKKKKKETCSSVHDSKQTIRLWHWIDRCSARKKKKAMHTHSYHHHHRHHTKRKKLLLRMSSSFAAGTANRKRSWREERDVVGDPPLQHIATLTLPVQST